MPVLRDGFDEWEPDEHELRVSELFESRMRSVTLQHRTDWAQRLIAIKELPEETPADADAKYRQLSRIHEEFAHVATMYGSVIIQERHLAIADKTIKPIHSRTCDAGGERHKFEVCNIRFKFATDDDGIFNGSDEAASKAAGAELLGNFHFSHAEDGNIHVPLFVLVDYLGYRLKAVASLPLMISKYSDSGKLKSRKEQLVVGSEDRGETMKGEDVNVMLNVNRMGARLNLLEHGIKGFRDIIPRFVATPADLKVLCCRAQGPRSACVF